MAMEDALMLARCLHGAAPPQRAFARYEELRRPRTERIVATGRRRGTYKAPKSRVAVTLRDLLMPLAFRFFVTEKSMVDPRLRGTLGRANNRRGGLIVGLVDHQPPDPYRRSDAGLMSDSLVVERGGPVAGRPQLTGVS